MYRKDLEKAKETLDKGGILGVPTETVYGLAVKSDNTNAIRNFKRTPSWKRQSSNHDGGGCE